MRYRGRWSVLVSVLVHAYNIGVSISIQARACVFETRCRSGSARPRSVRPAPTAPTPQRQRRAQARRIGSGPSQHPGFLAPWHLRLGRAGALACGLGVGARYRVSSTGTAKP